MASLSPFTRLYIAVVFGIGALAWWVTPGDIPWIPTLIFGIAGAIMEAFPVVRRDGTIFSLAGMISCLAIAALGTKAGMTAVALGLVFALFKLRLSWVQVVYNLGQLMVMAWVSGTIYESLGGAPGELSVALLLPYLVMQMAYWLTNSVMFSILLSLLTKSSLIRNLKKDGAFLAQQSIIMVINCTVLASYWAYSEWALAVLIVVLLLVRYALAAYDKAQTFYIRVIKLLTGVMEAQDRFTHGHSERVAHYAIKVGQTLRLSEAQLDQLRTAALLHDVGKMKIPRDVLHKVTPLTEEEFALIKEHPVTGAEWVGKLDLRGNLAKIIRHHHERWDGKGYPDGLAGEEIPELARIITVVDAFDAMTSDRPYRASMSPEHALSILKNQAGTQFDPRVVKAFLACADEAIREVPQPSFALANFQAQAAAAAADHDESSHSADKRRKQVAATEQAAGRV